MSSNTNWTAYILDWLVVGSESDFFLQKKKDLSVFVTRAKVEHIIHSIRASLTTIGISMSDRWLFFADWLWFHFTFPMAFHFFHFVHRLNSVLTLLHKLTFNLHNSFLIGVGLHFHFQIDSHILTLLFRLLSFFRFELHVMVKARWLVDNLVNNELHGRAGRVEFKSQWCDSLQWWSSFQWYRSLQW